MENQQISLFTLPADVLVEILTFIANLKDIGRLILAVNNRQCRKILLHLLNTTQGEVLIILPGIGFNIYDQDCCDWVSNHGIAIRELEIPKIYDIGDISDLPFSQFRYLEKLSLVADIDDELMADLISNCPNLKHLIIPESRWSAHGVTPPAELLEEIGTLTALQSLDLIGVDDITDNVLAAIGSGCALLQSLKLKLTNGRVSNAGLLSLMKHKSLRLLHLHGKDGIRWWNITPNGIVELLSHGGAIEDLDIFRGENRITSDDVLFSIGASCPLLRRLSLWFTMEDTDKATGAGLETIAANCPLLEYLELIPETSLTDDGLSRIHPGAFAALQEVRLCLSADRDHYIDTQ